MRSTLAAAFILVMTSSIFAAERPQPPASFAPVADAVKATVFSVVVPYEDADEPFVKKALRMQAEMRRRAWWN